MARSIAKFTIGFGLINIPVALYTAVRDETLGFRKLCPEHGCRIKMQTVCETHGEVLETTNKGYEIEEGTYVTLSEADFDRAAVTLTETFEIEACIPESAIDPRFFEKPYFVCTQPKVPAKPYALLREALRSSGRLAIGRVTIRQKQSVAALRVLDNALVMHLMRWPAELLEHSEYTFPSAELSELELQMAHRLIESMPAEFDADAFVDQYRANLMEIIDARAKDVELEPVQAETPRTTAADSLLQMLEASVAIRAAA